MELGLGVFVGFLGFAFWGCDLVGCFLGCAFDLVGGFGFEGDLVAGFETD